MLWKHWVLIAALSLPALSHGQRLELEIDPSPYAADGYSLHLGHVAGDGRRRAQVGIFAADVPEWLHGNDDFDLRVRAATIKLDHFFCRQHAGLFCWR